MEEASSTASSNAALGKTEAELFKAAREGILQGLVGRLSELGTIDDRYDVAVGAAAGGPLRNIVVERADQAQDCVEYLRKNNLGRATFIILEKLEYLRRDMDAWKDGAKSKRLFDLIRVQDPMHRLAFYFALRDTLVAEDLDEATKLAYQPTRRNRVVTVAGQLIESSGAMTGGGHQAPRAHLGSRTTQTTSSSDLAHMKQQLTELVDALNKLRADINHLQAELKTIDHDIAQLEMSLEKMSMDLRSLNEREIELVNQLPQLQTAVKTSKSGPGDRKLQQLKGVLETKEAELAEAKAPHDKLEREISKLQEKILAAGGSPLQKAKERKEATSIRLEEVSVGKSKKRRRSQLGSRLPLFCSQNLHDALHSVLISPSVSWSSSPRFEGRLCDLQANCHDRQYKVCSSKGTKGCEYDGRGNRRDEAGAFEEQRGVLEGGDRSGSSQRDSVRGRG